MRPRDDLLDRLASIRPADPDQAEATRISVRVLARIAVLEAGHSQVAPRTRPPSGRSRLVAAAVLLAALIPLATLAPSSPVDPAWQTNTTASIWRRRVAAALRGDAVHRQRVLHGGLPARRALLAHVEAGRDHGREALDLLAQAGAVRGAAEVERVTVFIADPDLRPAALRLLASDLGPAGPEGLGRLLVEMPEAESEIVDALYVVATGGRRESALRGLLEGAAAGRRLAAAAAIELGSASCLSRVLAVLPAGAETDARIVAATRAAPRTLRTRLVRMAARGDGRAEALATAAGDRRIVPHLARGALDPDPARAREAVDRLAAIETTESQLALARALDGPAGARAREHLVATRAVSLAELRACAECSIRDAPAAMRALSAKGAPGIAMLLSLAGRSQLAPEALRALAESEEAAASAALEQLAARPALRSDSILALGGRLAGGHAEAAQSLLRLARTRHGRAVFPLLARLGKAGVAVLKNAEADPDLRDRAKDALARVPEPAGGTGRRVVRVDRRSRSKTTGASRSI